MTSNRNRAYPPMCCPTCAVDPHVGDLVDPGELEEQRPAGQALRVRCNAGGTNRRRGVVVAAVGAVDAFQVWGTVTGCHDLSSKLVFCAPLTSLLMNFQLSFRFTH